MWLHSLRNKSNNNNNSVILSSLIWRTNARALQVIDFHTSSKLHVLTRIVVVLTVKTVTSGVFWLLKHPK